MSEGLKFDSGKQGWFAMPLVVLRPLADVFNHGRKKYGLFNCLKGFVDSDERFWDANMRHLEDSQLDPLAVNPKDGNVYHLAQCAFNCLLRLYCAIKERGHAPNYLATSCNEEGVSVGSGDIVTGHSDGIEPVSSEIGVSIDRKRDGTLHIVGVLPAGTVLTPESLLQAIQHYSIERP